MSRFLTTLLSSLMLVGAVQAAEPPAPRTQDPNASVIKGSETPEAISEAQALSSFLYHMSLGGPDLLSKTAGISSRSATDLIERYKSEEKGFQDDATPLLDQEHRDRLCSGDGTREAVLAEIVRSRDAVAQRQMEGFTRALSILTTAEREKVHAKAMEFRSNITLLGSNDMEKSMGGTSNYRAANCGGAQ